MPVDSPMLVKAGLSLAAAATLAVARRIRRSLPPRITRLAWILSALVAFVAYYDSLRFEGGGYLHHWEMFHYALGAKYFPELGYDGIYAGSLEAQRESDPAYPLPEKIRDLDSGQVVPPSALFDRGDAVRARFTPERWREFVEDHRHFLSLHPGHLERVRRDHGFNATPAWIAIARGMLSFVSIDRSGLIALGWLDPLLLLVGFAALYAAFGVRAASIAVIVFGLGFLNRSMWIAGAFLRVDWLVATLLALAALEKRAFATAGALFGYAAAMRVFPGLLLFGPIVVCAMEQRRSPRSDSLLRLGSGFAASAVVALVLGSLAGRGVSGWSEFAAHIAKHASGWLNNNVGLRQCLVHVYHLTQQPIDCWGEHMKGPDWTRRTHALHASLPWLAPVAAIPYVALVGLASRHATAVQAAAYGIAIVFALTQPTCYYWSILMLVPLAGALRSGDATDPDDAMGPTIALLLLGAAFHVVGAFTGGTTQGSTVYGVACWALAVFFAAWLVPLARDRSRADSGR